MVGKLLGGGLVLLGTALLCRAETRTRRQQTERLAELSAALSEMAAGIRSLRRTLPCLLRQQTRRPLCGAYFGAVLEGLESGQPLPDAWADAFWQLEPPAGWTGWRIPGGGTGGSRSGFCGPPPCPGRDCLSSY